VKINLTNESFVPGKKNYERVRIALEERLTQKFDIIVSWDPPGIYLCLFYITEYIQREREREGEKENSHIYIHFFFHKLFQRSACAHHL